MTRRSIFLVMLIASCALLSDRPLPAQQQGSATGGTGSQTAGSASTLSSSQGFGLNPRFGGAGFDVYTSGSAAMGTTTAGARAGTAGFVQTVTGGGVGNTGGFGRLGGIGGVGGIGGIGGLGGIGGMYGFGRNNSGQNQQQSGQGNKVIRTRTKLGFTQPAPPSTVIIASYGKVIRRVLDRGDYGGGAVNVGMGGRIAVLTGTVESSHARDIAERLALLEPGISEVRNELTVRAAAPTAETSPRSNSAGRPQ